MMDPFLNPVVLGSLYIHALGRAFLRYRNPLRRASGQHLAEFYERVWREASARLGAEFVPLGAGISDIRLNGRNVRVYENASPMDDPVTGLLIGNKPLTYRLLAERGLPTPRHAEFTLKAIGPAAEFLRSARVDSVVKPAAGTGGGRGVTTGIRSRAQLARAAAAAAVYGDELLIEEQLEGDNYRLLYLDGELIDAFVRKPPTVVADGRSAISKLVREANEARLRHRSGLAHVLLTVDLDMKRTLAKQGLTLSSTPGEGTVVPLKTVVNENCGIDNASASHVICPAVVEAGARAARALRVRLAGIDMITRDATVPLEESGGAILELNAPPNYYIHYHKRDGAFPVAVRVLERLFFGGTPSSKPGLGNLPATHQQEAFR